MSKLRMFALLLAGLVVPGATGCAKQPTVGGDLALLFIPTPVRLIGCVLGGCERTPVEGEYKDEVSGL